MLWQHNMNCKGNNYLLISKSLLFVSDSSDVLNDSIDSSSTLEDFSLFSCIFTSENFESDS